MAIRALIIDYKALSAGDTDANRRLLHWAGGRGLSWCLAVGKYGRSNRITHTTYTPTGSIDPFQPNALASSDFTERSIALDTDPGAQAHIAQRLAAIISDAGQ